MVVAATSGVPVNGNAVLNTSIEDYNKLVGIDDGESSERDGPAGQMLRRH